MIPKIIHYCWFGQKAFSKQAIYCINSWKKFLPDFKIIEWNESNFDISQYKFCEEAYRVKKYAFVSDVCRIHVLNEYGGIYFDTDVEVIQNFDDLLNLKSFTGFEDDYYVQTAILGSVKKSNWTEDLLIYYKNQSFILPDGALNTVPNPKIFSAMLELKGLLLNNTYQNVNDIIIYPKDFFSPKDFETSKITITKNTRAINHFSASWLPWSIIIKLKLKTLLLNLVGKNTFYKIKNWINVL